MIVTGSNIPTAEEVGPNPVDTYRRDDITRLGVRTPTDLIQRIPSAMGSTTTEANTNGGDGSTRVDLRGIDPKETLVLQDGRRLQNAGTQSVDFNVFPLGLIDHIDILKDGASPIYGTDAVSGVVNVFLIHRFRGVEVYASYGNTNLGFAGDRGEESIYLLAGTGDDKTNIVVYAGLYNAAGIFSRDVQISHDADKNRFGGFDVRSGNFAGRITTRQFLGTAKPPFNNGLLTPTPHAFANQFTDPEYTNRASPHLPSERRFFNFADLTPAVAPTDREYLYGSFDRDICDKYLTIFADFKYFRQFWDGGLAPSPFTPDIWTDATHPFGISSAGMSVPTQNAFNPFTVADYTSPGGFDTRFPNTQASSAPAGTQFTTGVRYRSLEAGLRTFKVRTDNYVFTAGLKGNLGEFANAWDMLKTWEWETAVRYNESERTVRFGGITNNNALRTALLDTNPATAFNMFGLNQNSKFVKDRVFVTTTEIERGVLLTEDLTLRGDMFNLPGGPVSFAIGSIHLSNTFQDNPDALTASGQTTGSTNFAPTRGSRDSWSVFWEARIPITGPTWNFPGAYSLELTYAERYENFSDFGQTERPKFSVRWQPIDTALTLRASYIEAFHAPSLGELFSGTSQSFPNVKDPLGASEPQVEQHLLGNKTLQPEIAYEYTYGGVVTPGKWWAPLTGLTLSADLVHIDIRQYTTSLDAQFVINNAGPGGPFQTFTGGPGPLNTTFVQRNGPGGGIVLVNTPETNTGRLVITAWDYEAVEIFETSRLGHGDMGTLTATFNGTYNADIDLQTIPNGKRQTVVGKFGGGFQGTNGGGSFTHNRWYTSLFYDGPSGTWAQGIDAGAVVHYVGQYWDSVTGTFFDLRRADGVPDSGHTSDGSGPDPCSLFSELVVGTAHVGKKDPGFIPCAGNFDRKVREWVTVDLIVQYTFNLPPPVAQTEVAGYAKDGGKNVRMKDGKDKNVMPVSTAEYNPCGWRAWLNNMTLTLGVDNVGDLDPPYVSAAFENGYDEQTSNVKGRLWFAAIKKRF
ncbi:MAG TPA: TonB-dependent receptor [Chthoniobacterales bacterium]|nr:TonB-dependent receptor [Chthoniobacterales bacterium]